VSGGKVIMETKQGAGDQVPSVRGSTRFNHSANLKSINKFCVLSFILLLVTVLLTAANVSASWEIATIDSVNTTGDVGRFTSIKADSNNKLHISYHDLKNDYLKYATNASGAWSTSIIDTTASYNSIAVDKNNKVHISYYKGITSSTCSLFCQKSAKKETDFIVNVKFVVSLPIISACKNYEKIYAFKVCINL